MIGSRRSRRSVFGPARAVLRGPLDDATTRLVRAGFRPTGWGRFERRQEVHVKAAEGYRPPWVLRARWTLAVVTPKVLQAIGAGAVLFGIAYAIARASSDPPHP